MIKQEIIGRVLEKALSGGADFAELFVEDTYASSIHFNAGQTKHSIVGNDSGAGIRVFYGHTAIYAYTNDLSEKALIKAASAVSQAASGPNSLQPADLRVEKIKNRHPVLVPNNTVPKTDKIAFLRQIDQASRQYDDLITQVDISLSERMQQVMIANSEGLWAEDHRNYSRVYVSSIASRGNEKQTGSEGPGGMAGYEFFQKLDPVALGRNTAAVAVLMLKAKYAPSGKFPVVIDNGFGGVIFHEACGHSLETTSVAKGASVFADKLGQQIANPVVTAIDDGTIPNAWGSENIDDEGTPTEKTVLIQDGILKSFMIDRLGGLKIARKSTGSGRRASYMYAPTSRMRNTYIAAGKHKLADLISSIDYGIYARKMGGGSVLPGTGNFNFSVAEGYIIRNGKITEPVRGATLIGNGPDVLMKIGMVADNLAHAQGMCGSLSGSLPANVGQPAIKIDEIVVGGR